MPTITRTDGSVIAYNVAGAGPAIVLHPGMPMPGGSFPPSLVESLAESGHLVVANDPRDTGRSTRYEGPPIGLRAILGGDLASAIAWGIDVSRWSLGRHFDEATALADSARLVDEFAWWGIPAAHLAAALVALPERRNGSPCL